MSLRVWLPLNGDLHNQGLSNVTVTNNGATVNTSGKIGSCYEFNNSKNISLTDYVSEFLTYTNWSISLWFKCTAQNTAHTGSALISSGNWNYPTQLLQFSLGYFSTDHYTKLLITNSSSWSNGYTYNFYLNTWYHVVLVSGNNKMSAYVNGELIGDSFSAYTPVSSAQADIGIGKATYYSGMSFFGLINDVRIYDHALSAMEIKEIARGLVLHYPLCENLGSGLNLIKNGFGELGTDNWTSKTMFSNDVPENQPEIKQSVYGNSTLEYIPFWHNCTYRISLWVKSTASSGNSYPSFIPYDIDKNQIQVRHTKYGFNMSTMTTLAQPLNPGDTKIYVTDLSKWNAASGHYYNYAAIFGYADSTGYIYPDGIYTRNIPAFGSGASEKTNLDKTNNIINLINTYNGPAIPAGRSVCASCDGSTYFYPFGSIANTSIQDWTYKTATFTSNNNYLVAARFLRFINVYNTTYCAGIKLVNESTIKTNNIIYDISGYCNNGTIIGDLEVSTDTPKYNVSTNLTTTSSHIATTTLTTAGFTNSYSISWWGNVSTYSRKMMWGFSNGNRLNGIYNGNLWNTGDGSSNPLYQPGTTTQVSAPTTNVWHHFVMVGDGTTCKVYKDGELWGQAKTYKSLTGTIIYFNGWTNATTYALENTKLSDFRIYATALSAQDILSLYHNSALVDEQGIVHGAIH